jgi:glycosyltransferase involved in cell wall biosynthesis
VVITAYNAADTIEAAILSILDQSLKDINLIVIDDGSTDDTSKVVSGMTDRRLSLVTAQHRGRSAALNEAVQRAVGEYIALNDADDISLPERLAAQVDYLDQHPQIAAVSGQIIAIEDGRRWDLHWPTTPSAITRELNAGRMPIANACVMMRRDWLIESGGYNESLPRLEDLELFHRTRATATFAALDVPLLEYCFRTLPYAQWSREESLRSQVTGTAVNTGRLAYMRYRIAVGLQRRGIGVTRSSRSL